MDPIAQFKENQKLAWAGFAPTEIFTCQPAARLVVFARVAAGQRVLDVACGTGVVALAAARAGAHVTGLDLTPELLAHARQNAAVAGAEIDWHEGDVEAMPFEDASFDVVVSQFGHMFAPRPDVAIREMLRVLAPGGTIAFVTWPPELLMGKISAVIGSRLGPPPPGVSPPPQWGIPDIVRERLGDAVDELTFDRGTLRSPTLSLQHMRKFLEDNIGPAKKLVQMLAGEPEKLAEFRREIEATIAPYFEPAENVIRQDYLLTRARKR